MQNAQQVVNSYDAESQMNLFRKIKKRILAKNESVVVPKALNLHRMVVGVRVMKAESRKTKYGVMKCIDGRVENCTSKYIKTEEIVNHKGAPVGTVDKTNDVITLVAQKMDDFEPLKSTVEMKFGKIRDGSASAKLIYNDGDRVFFKVDDKVDISGATPFSYIRVGLSATYYCVVPDKQNPSDPMFGISVSVKEIEVMSGMEQKQLFDMFQSDLSCYQLPWKSPLELMKSNSYTHVCVADEKRRSKQMSNETLFIPINYEDPEAFFEPLGCGLHAFTSFGSPDAQPFSWLRRADKVFVRRADGSIVVQEWQSKLQLRSFKETEDENQLHQYRIPITMWAPLPLLKIEAVDPWIKFAPIFFSTMPMVIYGKVKLYETADNPMNSQHRMQQDPVRMLALNVIDVAFDLVAFLIKHALPVSGEAVRSWVKLDDVRMQAWTSPKDMPRVRVARNQLDDPDTSYLNLKEFEGAGLKAFLASPAFAEHDFYALVDADSSDFEIEMFDKIRAYKAKKGSAYVGPLADPLLWDNWHSTKTAVKYTSAMGGNEALNIPADHPLVAPGEFSTALKHTDMIIYAVNRKERRHAATTTAISAIQGGDAKVRRLAIESAPTQMPSAKKQKKAKPIVEEEEEEEEDEEDEEEGEEKEGEIDEVEVDQEANSEEVSGETESE